MVSVLVVMSSVAPMAGGAQMGSEEGSVVLGPNTQPSPRPVAHLGQLGMTCVQHLPHCSGQLAKCVCQGEDCDPEAL